MANTATITLGGRELLLRASNWASQLYATEFYGLSGDGYNGSLAHDAAQVYSDCVGSVNPDGTVTINFVTPKLWGVVWALAYAAGSVTVGYKQWMDSVRDEIWSVDEEAEACVEVIDLMMRTFFRQRAQQGGAEPAE